MMHIQRFGLPSAAGASLAEAREHLRIDHIEDDAALDVMLTAATRDLEQYAGIALLTQPIRVRWKSSTGLFTAAPRASRSNMRATAAGTFCA